MRWTGMPVAMWGLFVKSFQKQLTVLGYDAAAAKENRDFAGDWLSLLYFWQSLFWPEYI